MQKPFEDATYGLQVRCGSSACLAADASPLRRCTNRAALASFQNYQRLPALPPTGGFCLRILQVGELSGIIDTDSGVHIILRTA